MAFERERLILQRHGNHVAAVISAEGLKRLEELEDRADLNDMDDVLARGETPIPWKQAKAQLGVK